MFENIYCIPKVKKTRIRPQPIINYIDKNSIKENYTIINDNQNKILAASFNGVFYFIPIKIQDQILYKKLNIN